VLFVDSQRANEQNFIDFLTHTEGLFELEAHTPMSYLETSVGGDAFPDQETRTVIVHTGVPGPDCGGDCEGYEWIEITFDEQGEIVALHVSAAG
jgi:hypothetical protein